MSSQALDVHRQALPNGLRLLVWPNRNLPLVTLLGVVRTGVDCNPLDLPGLASMTACLLEEGTLSFPANQLLHAVENVGGQLVAFSQREVSGIAFTLAPEHVRQGVELLAEMLRAPVFPPDRFLLERERTLNDLQSLEDEPHFVASDLLDSLIYEGTPFAQIPMGTEESLRAMRRRDILLFHERNYAPANSLIVAVGACSPDEMVGEVEARFGDWSNPHFRTPPEWTIERRPRRRANSVRLEKEQVHVCLGHLGIRRSHPDYHALKLVDVILGSGPGFMSRIPRSLRDEQGLAYSAYSDITSSSGLFPGRFLAYVATAPQKAKRAVDGLLVEIESLRCDGVTEEELRIAKSYLTGSAVFQFQSNADRARFLVLSELFNLPHDYPERYLQEIEEISSQEVARVARLHLDTLNYGIVCAGPISKESEIDWSQPDSH